MTTPPEPDPAEHLSETTIQVRAAFAGEMRSLSWVVQHFTPFLLVDARRRVGRHLGRVLEPEDLVQRTWMISLPRLHELRPRGGRLMPVLLRFLASVQARDYSNLLRQHARGQPLPDAAEIAAGVPDEATGVVSALVKAERKDELTMTIAALAEEERDLLVQRGLEQRPYAELAAEAGVAESVLRLRYHRLLQKLRKALPASVVDELEAELG